MVEVVAMLGDSVVGMKHCADPGGGKVRPTTWAMIAVGVIALVVFAVAFWTAVDLAADDVHRYAYVTTVLHKPAFAFRPQPLPAGCDWLAFGGLLVSIVAFTLALGRASDESPSPFARIGTASGVDFPVAGAPAPDFAMIAPHGDAFAFRCGPGMTGEIRVGESSTALAALAPIPANATIRVNVGALALLVSVVERPRRTLAPVVGISAELARSLAGTTFAFTVVVLLLLRIPVDAGGSSIELGQLEDTTARWTTTEHESAPQRVDLFGDEEDSGGTGRSMTLEAGAMGRKDSPRASGTYLLADRMQDPQLARQEAIEHARTAGILGPSALGDAVASLTGTSDLSSGFEFVDLLGGKLGSAPGEMNGGFGFARSAFGPGGGGTGWGTICAGRFGTIGHGSGTGDGYGVSGGTCGLMCRGHGAATPTVSIGQPVAIGDLEKPIVRRYVRRNLDKITYCYERQLLAKPALSGTVTAQFFITPAGKVANATAAGVDVEVASCVADVISNIEFPRPSGGGGVQVSYPFTFHST